MRNRWIALLLVSSALAGPLRAATYYVDGSVAHLAAMRLADAPDWDGSAEHPFGDIQTAIDLAADGDKIVVAPGHYLSADTWKYAELSFEGKSIRLVSSAPTDFSVVEQTVLCGVVVLDGVEDANCLLQGFKIQNYDCGGILGNGTQATVSHCILSGNGPCGATVIKDVQGPIRNCLIVDNTTFHDCGTGPVVSGCPTFVNCTIANNASGVEISSEGITDAYHVFLKNCIVHGNQGNQVTSRWTGTVFMMRPIEYCLLETLTTSSGAATRGGGSEGAYVYGDPCFVQVGRWADVDTSTATRMRGYIPPPVEGTKVLIEGDYHLRTEGWRWSSKPVHGSNWCYDATTSLGVDRGDPLDALGEELERTPDDPEGKWGFNHAIDQGAYGGTSQASLSPTYGEAPGVGAVDIRDYWPLAGGNNWYIHNADGSLRVINSTTFISSTESYLSIGFTGAPDWVKYLNYYYADKTFYLAQPPATATRPPQPLVKIQAQYPEFPVTGSTVDVPHNPFTTEAVTYERALVVRGTLAEVLAGAGLDPAALIEGPWPDVIAFKKVREDGTAGEPIVIFARGLGPLFIAGYPVTGAYVNSETFGNPWATATRR
jgi:hypothetical protein